MSFDLPVMLMTALGGLALFLYGIDLMSSALKAMADDGLRRLLGGLTRNRFYGILTGAFATAIVQSSSVTTVLAVGFISAGLLSLNQSVGIIMGAHLGTRLWSHDPNRIEVYRLESRVLEIERRIFYFAKRIAKTVIPGEEWPASSESVPPGDKAEAVVRDRS